MAGRKWLPALVGGRQYEGWIGVNANGVPQPDLLRPNHPTAVYPSKAAARRAGNANVRRVTIYIEE